MMDSRPSNPALGRSYCPGCETNADPSEEILEVNWCDPHAPTRAGFDDARVTSAGFLSGTDEAGGDSNRRWCELLHEEARRQ
jgi:hypothetical protein